MTMNHDRHSYGFNLVMLVLIIVATPIATNGYPRYGKTISSLPHFKCGASRANYLLRGSCQCGERRRLQNYELGSVKSRTFWW